MAAQPQGMHERSLPGEDLEAATAAETSGWIVVYEQLSALLGAIIERSNDGNQREALRDQLRWVESRRELWRRRHARASGIVLDERRVLAHGTRRVRLTRREVELLDFLLRHPGRRFTTKELASLAWRSPWLSAAQVRTYLMRLRRRLAEVGLGDVARLSRPRGYGIAHAVDEAARHVDR